MEMQTTEELFELFEATCNGRCDEAMQARLEGLLLTDPELVRTYVQYCDMHATLRWLAAPVQCLSTDEESARRIAELLHPSAWSRLKQGLNRHSFLVLAASMLLALFSFWFGSHLASSGNWPFSHLAITTGDGSIQVEQAVADSVASGGVARITGLVDCHWGEGQPTFQFGDLVTGGGRVTLEEGLLQLTFNSGAKVIIQGPASFVAESAMNARLEHGKLSAIVSESARGYTVKTPTAEVVDLGTEFALEVEADGATELHVLEGDVIARQLRSEGELHGEAIQARKSQALRFGNQAENVIRIAANPDRFIRQITPKLTSEELPPLPVVDTLKFWVAADLLVTRRDGHVSAWRDVCIGDNQTSNDACQFSEDQQPSWVADAGNGKPAIRFNGSSNRLTTDEFSTGDQVSIFVAFIPSRSGQNYIIHGGQLVNFGGFAPTIEICVHADRSIYSGLWAANAFGQEVTTGVVRDQTVELGVPSVLCYVYDVDADRAELWLNGYSTGSVPAPLRAKTKSTRTLGGHGDEENKFRFYQGDIQEVLIYDSALSAVDRTAVTDYLQLRYRAGN